jgi:hypothetical protein
MNKNSNKTHTYESNKGVKKWLDQKLKPKKKRKLKNNKRNSSVKTLFLARQTTQRAKWN